MALSFLVGVLGIYELVTDVDDCDFDCDFDADFCADVDDGDFDADFCAWAGGLVGLVCELVLILETLVCDNSASENSASENSDNPHSESES